MQETDGRNPRCFAMHKKPTRKGTQEQASQTANARKRSRETWANSGSLSGARLNTTKDELEQKRQICRFLKTHYKTTCGNNFIFESFSSLPKSDLQKKQANPANFENA